MTEGGGAPPPPTKKKPRRGGGLPGMTKTKPNHNNTIHTDTDTDTATATATATTTMVFVVDTTTATPTFCSPLWCSSSSPTLTQEECNTPRRDDGCLLGAGEGEGGETTLVASSDASCTILLQGKEEDDEEQSQQQQFLIQTLQGNTAIVTLSQNTLINYKKEFSYSEFVSKVVQASIHRDLEVFMERGGRKEKEEEEEGTTMIETNQKGTTTTTTRSRKRCLEEEEDEEENITPPPPSSCWKRQRRRHCNNNNNNNTMIQLIHQGKILDSTSYYDSLLSSSTTTSTTSCRCEEDKNNKTTMIQQQDQQQHYITLRVPIVGGMVDRQNRVGSKFGGGGVSSGQNAERERKERLKQLALESIDLAKDPYLMRNHLGTYECKLCLTLHTNEANYLAHTQGKKHQQGLAKRAHMEKLRSEREGNNATNDIGTGGGRLSSSAAAAAAVTKQQQKMKIGRPAYQVFKSRDTDTNQRCLSFELIYPEIEDGIQPRHRFMSAFEQKIDVPPDRRYQYLLFAAQPYETVAFKIPNEPIDKGSDKFVTHWNIDEKKLTVTLHLMEPIVVVTKKVPVSEEEKEGDGTTTTTKASSSQQQQQQQQDGTTTLSTTSK